MSETFARPLVIGYIAFDRPIGANGILGRAVPTLQRMEGRIAEPAIPTKEEDATVFGIDENTDRINQWLRIEGTRGMLAKFLEQKKIGRDLIPNVILGAEYADLRKEIVKNFAIGANCG